MAQEMARETVGAMIARIREQRGLSQTRLAEILGIPRPSLAGIETDRVDRPNYNRLVRIAHALDVHPHTLLRAAGFEVGEAPPVRERTTEEILAELARHLKEKEHRADNGDLKARHEIQRVASFLSRSLVPA